MDNIIILTGGFGRVVSASGALIKYLENNPNDVVCVAGWTEALSGLFTQRLFQFNHPYLFDDVIKKRKIIEPEPYKDWNYYNKQMHITACFNGELNGSYEFIKPQFNLSQIEENAGYATIQNIKKQYPLFSKVFVIQGFGSTAQLVEREGQIFTLDNSNRSLPLNIIHSICKDNPGIAFLNLSQFNQLGIGLPNFLNLTQQVNQKMIASIVKSADAVISIDSMVNHIAACFDKPTLELFGGSDWKNLGYAQYLETHSRFVKDNYPKEYSETRINAEPNREFNKGAWNLTETELETLLSLVKELVC